jgi:formylglycine-generating enzyme required for sulfatase activity
MRTLSISILTLAVVASAWSQKVSDNFLLVEGGTFKNTKSNYYGKSVSVSDFYLGKYEVTQKEWLEVMGSNPSKFTGDNLPVDTVTWYDCVEYCNKRSIKEGLRPYYNIDKDNKDPKNGNELDDLRWTVTINAGADGYRLPTEAEWEYAAGGGRMSTSCVYSGSNNVDKVAWYYRNSGDKELTGFWSWTIIEQNNNRTKPGGGKEPNELGIYDMSGNVREWCWDWHGELTTDQTDPKGSSEGGVRVWKGGGWLGGDFCCEPSFRGTFEANGLGPDQGLRLCRDKRSVIDSSAGSAGAAAKK